MYAHFTRIFKVFPSFNCVLWIYSDSLFSYCSTWVNIEPIAYFVALGNFSCGWSLNFVGTKIAREQFPIENTSFPFLYGRINITDWRQLFMRLSRNLWWISNLVPRVKPRKRPWERGWYFTFFPAWLLVRNIWYNRFPSNNRPRLLFEEIRQLHPR